jgi:RND superfamily putative drug exporter
MSGIVADAMFALLADLAWRRPRRVLVAAIVLAIAAGAFGASTPSRLSASDNDYQDKGSESYRTFQLLSQRTGVIPGPSIVVIASRRDAAEAVSVLRRDPAVAAVRRAGRGGSVVVSAYLRDGSDTSGAARRIVHDAPGLVGGPAVASQQVRHQSERDLLRAELIAFPLLLVLGVWIFRGLVAALLPVAAGLLSIATTLAMLRIANSTVTISVFALNLVTGAGLGLAIDYSLLLLSRYREELAHSEPRAALQATIATAGRTVAFSAVTVAAAFASLSVFPLGFLRSMAIGGVAVALLAGVVALLVIPALFALLGRRVDSLAIRRGKEPGTGGWYRFAHGVMRRPLPIAVATAAVLVALGLPFLGVRFTGVDASVLPASASARQVQDAIKARAPEHVVSTSRATLARVGRLPGVAAMTPPRPLGGGLWTADVTPRARPMSGNAKALVRRIRALPGTRVGGVTAWYLDTSASLRSHLPAAGAILALTIVTLLYLVTRSVILPLKAVVMNALSLSAAFGVLVWVFQDGRLEGLLRYSSQGALELTQPVLLFAIAFGLATDYGVFLLSRIREAHESGLENREAVALGLERTGRVVTAAALLFCVAVGSFATSGIVIVKEIGIGIALAVAIDASLVRALLVPSLMALLGDWNWWRPGRKPG